MPIEAVIFDCDGVLVDSEHISVRTDAAVLDELGWPLSQDEIVERFVGRTHEYMVEEIEAQLGSPLANDWEDRFAHLYRDAFEAELAPVDGIVEALDRITIPVCVASSGGLDSVRAPIELGSTSMSKGGGGMTLATRPWCSAAKPMWKSAPSGLASCSAKKVPIV